MLDLDAMAARVNAATPPPWEARRGDRVLWTVWHNGSHGENSEADALFTAAARDAMPALVAEDRQLREELSVAYAAIRTYTQPAIRDGIEFCAVCGTALGTEGE